MENEIKVGDFIRTKDGIIDKIVDIRDTYSERKLIAFERSNSLKSDIGLKAMIIKHSSNLIDLIECGDYVNGKEVIMDLQKSKEWYKSKDDFITCKDYTFEKNEIKEVVTKEQMESITYKVTKM